MFLQCNEIVNYAVAYSKTEYYLRNILCIMKYRYGDCKIIQEKNLLPYGLQSIFQNLSIRSG
jgi:hypothetical protein